ncbi:hypothetical protein HPP92_000957 [Vanilla planifolia]|uniref:Methyltransferase type 11 domain-containing protein n=1 Tax=Vanilla planifolia TaxID=51239 RepID=A0A835RQ61_VANPL|nr:hypothetical protein HPP92_000957 [Vanilla planifolia]
MALFVLDIAAVIIGSGGCDSYIPAPLAGSTELDFALRKLISLRLLAAGDRAVFVGPNSAEAFSVAVRLGLPTAVASDATACCALPFKGESFDFAFSAAVDRARVPARVILEMERVLRPGQFGAVLRIRSGRGLMRAAAPVASLLRFSDVISARFVNGSALVIFRKRRGIPGGVVSNSLVMDAAIDCEGSITVLPRLVVEWFELARAAIVSGTRVAKMFIGRFPV